MAQDCPGYFYKINGVDCVGIQAFHAEGCGLALGGKDTHPEGLSRQLCEEFATPRDVTQVSMRTWGNLSGPTTPTFSGEVNYAGNPLGCLRHASQNTYVWNLGPRDTSVALDGWWRAVCKEVPPPPANPLTCDAGNVEIDRWCENVDPITGECPKVPAVVNGNSVEMVKGYPHGRSCSWPCGAPANIDLNQMFQDEYAAQTPGHAGLDAAREVVWGECRRLCEADDDCTAYTLNFKYFQCYLSTQDKPCGEYKYSCYVDGAPNYWETSDNCAINGALSMYTVKHCRAQDDSRLCPAAQPPAPVLQCDAGNVEIDRWCENVDPITGECPKVTAVVNGNTIEVVKGYPHGRSCSWPCGAPAQVNLNQMFLDEYAVSTPGHAGLDAAREKVWGECRRLCEADDDCTAYTLNFKYFSCYLSTQDKPCGEYKYSCHTAAASYWETSDNCAVNGALHIYTVKHCRAQDDSRLCPSATLAPPTDPPQPVECTDQTFIDDCVSKFVTAGGCTIPTNGAVDPSIDIDAIFAQVPEECFGCDNIGQVAEAECAANHTPITNQELKDLLREMLEESERLDDHALSGTDLMGMKLKARKIRKNLKEFKQRLNTHRRQTIG